LVELLLQILHWNVQYVLLASIKNKLSPLRTDAKHAGWASTVISQVKHHKQEPAKNVTKVDGHLPCLRSRVRRAIKESTTT
jgi:hypothetical protein